MNTSTPSPFHPDEQEIQSRLGVREKMERFGRQVIREQMPDQHQSFYNQLPFIFVGHADDQGWPWASILHGEPGFLRANTAKQLQLNATPIAGDPLAEALTTGTRLGLLGIELPTRRRNRLNGKVSGVSATGFQLRVDQSFGNCPQYIQTRELQLDTTQPQPAAEIEQLHRFDQQAMDLISRSDTFFVASALAGNDDDANASAGADVSHRGGLPGFIRIDDQQTLTIPDYLGNFHFNTLGNLQQHPRAGLLFIDFETGDLLTLTGSTEILWDSPETQYFDGAERLWRFHIKRGLRIKNALRLRWSFGQYSPNVHLTGTWAQAAANQQAEANAQRWLPYEVVKIVDENSHQHAAIRSYYLQPKAECHARHCAGQFLTLRAILEGRQQIRTYSLSSAPGDPLLRISVKREAAQDDTHPAGLFSNFLHDSLAVGDTLEAKAAAGSFTLDTDSDRPAVLISAGVGITPMVAMARHALQEQIRTRTPCSLTLISAARDPDQRVFFDELSSLAAQSGGTIRAFWALSQTDASLKPGIDFHHRGRISKQLLQAVLALDDYDFYLCGPAGFMQSIYDLLQQLGIADHRIAAEAFGPATLIRREDRLTTARAPVMVAETAVVSFSSHDHQPLLEQAWSREEGNLLGFAEAHGLTLNYGCRSGQCGSCKARLVSGKVSYPTAVNTALGDDEVLLCCAQPAPAEGDEMAKLSIALLES
jgi:ferredoxin-NADP reductase/predicted pyridoxine 5'-phosphate oxidase superfamily flavin-nucleotide-binding protein